MKLWTILKALLLVFLFWSIGTLIAKETRVHVDHTPDQSDQTQASDTEGGGSLAEPDVEVESGSVSESPPIDGIIAYYFHGHARCWSCVQIENLTDQAIHGNFQDDLDNNALVWRVVNIQEPSNEHFTEEYELYTKQVIIAEFRNGEQVRWKNLGRVWDLLRDEVAFNEYIRDEVQAYLEED